MNNTPDSAPKSSQSPMFESYHQQKPPLNVRSPSSSLYESSRPSSSLIMDGNKQNQMNLKATNEIVDFTTKKSSFDQSDQIVYGEDRCNHCGGLFTEVIFFLI